jgi:hypothetical protein
MLERCAFVVLRAERRPMTFAGFTHRLHCINDRCDSMPMTSELKACCYHCDVRHRVRHKDER